MEKFFNEEELSILMKEVVSDGRTPADLGTDECCSIAESMIEEIHQIALPECAAIPTALGRSKGSFRKRLLRQIREARKLAMI
jgi:hypothetical protein